MKQLQELFENNRQWAQGIENAQPEFFINSAKQQSPDYLWIGCADSRVPTNQLLGLAPGEIFVHRNIANVVVHTDLNCLSVMQYAIEVLNVKHVIVCGHYGCGGVKAALEGDSFGLIDNWLRHIKDVYRMHQQAIDAQPSEQAKLDLLCEKNVIEQVANVCNTSIVQNYWRAGNELTVHGVIYALDSGLLKSLDTTVNSVDQLSAIHVLKAL